MTTPSPSKSYPHWIYDGSVIEDTFGDGERAVVFLRRLRHPKSKQPGKAFVLDPWLERIVRRIYGPRNPDGSRIVKTVALLLPRGNRKTSISAALALLHLFGPERQAQGEVIFAASDRKQAGIAFREAVGIVQCDKRLVAATKIYDAFNSAKQITFPKDDSKLEVISSDAGSQHGRTPSFVLADELHIWPNRLLWEALTTGLDKTDNPLLIVASTAGRGQENVAWEFFDDARKVATGEVDDPSILPILFEAPQGATWEDEALWYSVNPGLRHGYPSLDGFRRHAKRAKRSMGERQSLLQLKLNIWLDGATDPFCDMMVYDEGKAPVDLAALKDKPCWLAIDLSSHTDLSVIVAAWRTDAGGYVVHPWYFTPKSTLEERERVSGWPYRRWIAEGHITATEGSVQDYDLIATTIEALCEEYDVQSIGFDPALANLMMQRCMNAGLPVVEHRQGALSMMPALSELTRVIEGAKFQHGGHPVLRANFANAEAKQNDLGHKIKIKKAKKWLSIDGAVATAMAVNLASHGEVSRSIYDDPEEFEEFMKAI